LEGSGNAVDWYKACARERRTRRLEAKSLGVYITEEISGARGVDVGWTASTWDGREQADVRVVTCARACEKMVLGRATNGRKEGRKYAHWRRRARARPRLERKHYQRFWDAYRKSETWWEWLRNQVARRNGRHASWVPNGLMRKWLDSSRTPPVGPTMRARGKPERRQRYTHWSIVRAGQARKGRTRVRESYTQTHGVHGRWARQTRREAAARARKAGRWARARTKRAGRNARGWMPHTLRHAVGRRITRVQQEREAGLKERIGGARSMSARTTSIDSPRRPHTAIGVHPTNRASRCPHSRAVIQTHGSIGRRNILSSMKSTVQTALGMPLIISM
ncbi:Unknown protein, partial [Striga hermonthica]